MKFRYVDTVALGPGTIAAHSWGMSTLRLGLGAAIFLLGCTPINPAQNTFPQPEPTQVAGPPGGQIDPGYGYQQPPQQDPVAYNADQQGYPQGYPDGNAPGSEAQPAEGYAPNGPSSVDQTMPPSLEPSADPNDAGYDMGQVNDDEIDASLDGYGQWEESEDYGRVWVPDTTAVGVDFTPYETDGSWIWSDAGWNYQCDLSWGWLPFHYGRWGWFDNHWGWQPGHQWSPGAVEWRGGGGYTGWRPLTPIIRDHRAGVNIRDHRTVTASDSQWRFASNNEFGKGHIKGHLFQNPSEGLRVTSLVQHPNLRGNYAPVSSASLMRNRLSSNFARNNQAMRSNNVARPQAQQGPRNEGVRPQQQQGFRSQPNNTPYRGTTSTTPTWRRPDSSYRAPQQQSYRPTYRPPAQSYSNRGYTQPSRSYNGPSHTYAPPSRSYSGSFSPSRGSSAPSHSSSNSGGSFHSSGGGGSSHSSGGGGGSSHSSGGGGRHR